MINMSDKVRQEAEKALKDHQIWVDVLTDLLEKNGNVEQAAEQMQVSRQAFYRSLKTDVSKMHPKLIRTLLIETEEPFIKLIRAVLGIHDQQPLYISEEIETSFLQHAKTTLSDMQYDILARHFGLESHDQETFEQIGNTYNITRERCRQIEAKALRLLRSPESIQYLFPDNTDQLIKTLNEIDQVKNLRDSQIQKMKIAQQSKNIYDTQLQHLTEPNASWNEHTMKAVELEYIGLDIRSYHVLFAHGCKTLYDVVQLTEEEISTFRNAGKNTVINIKYCLKKNFGLTLKANPSK